MVVVGPVVVAKSVARRTWGDTCSNDEDNKVDGYAAAVVVVLLVVPERAE